MVDFEENINNSRIIVVIGDTDCLNNDQWNIYIKKGIELEKGFMLIRQNTIPLKVFIKKWNNIRIVKELTFRTNPKEIHKKIAQFLIGNHLFNSFLMIGNWR